MSDRFTAIDQYIGQAIRRVRKERRIRQAEMGRVLGITGTAYGRFELGIRRISAHHLFLIAKALNVPIEEFFPKDDSNEQGLQPPPRPPEPLGA